MEDVTRHYTSDEFSEIRSRREKENWDLERGGAGMEMEKEMETEKGMITRRSSEMPLARLDSI